MATDPLQDPFCLHLSGNGVRRALMGTFMSYVVGCLLAKQEHDDIFRFRSVSFQFLPQDEDVDAAGS